MLGLRLRPEFKTNVMPDTAIVLRRGDGTGAVEVGPDAFFAITYPTADIEKALLALSQEREHRPILLIGDRGFGKSHLLAIMYYAFAYPRETEAWAHEWGERLGNEALLRVRLQQRYLPIAETMHGQPYQTVWDLLLHRHPKGRIIDKAFRRANATLPSPALLTAMFEMQPTAFMLDEFQTWFDGVYNRPGTDLDQVRERTFAFTQILSEIALARPDLLRLVICVRNNQTDAFRQVHRVDPLVIDFNSRAAHRDRQRLVLHRLFANRREIAPDLIRQRCTAYGAERSRLLFTHEHPFSIERSIDEVVATWPFSPELFNLMEELVLFSSSAQSTRDLIKVLARLYRSADGACDLLTPADIDLMSEGDDLQTLLYALSDGDATSLCQVARQNLQVLLDAHIPAPHASALISALWVRSLSVGQRRGATSAQLHVDLCGRAQIDDNAFADELALVRENSFNIHNVAGADGALLCFKKEENLRARIKAYARNDKLFREQEEMEYLCALTERILTEQQTQPAVQVLALLPDWLQNPWRKLEPPEPPGVGEAPLLLILPEYPANLHATLGQWLKRHVLRGRNAVWFLMPRAERISMYRDPELLYWARIAYLTKWSDIESGEREIFEEFEGRLRKELANRFERLAILYQWNFPDPQQCRFHVEALHARGGEITSAALRHVLDNLFVDQDFVAYLVRGAERLMTVGELIDELREPPPQPIYEAFPFVGLPQIREKLLRVAATGAIYLNVAGSWIGKRPEHENDEATLQLLRQHVPTAGRALLESKLGLPAFVGLYTPQLPLTNRPIEVMGALPAVTPEDLQQWENEPPRYTEGLNGLSLLDQFERWGFRIDDQFSSFTLDFGAISMREIRQILQRVPPTVKPKTGIVRRIRPDLRAQGGAGHD